MVDKGNSVQYCFVVYGVNMFDFVLFCRRCEPKLGMDFSSI